MDFWEGSINIYPLNPVINYDPLGLLGQCSGGNCDSDGGSIFGSAVTSIKNAFPNSKEGWANYLAMQADIFGTASLGLASIVVLAPAAPVAAAIGSAADAGSKMLKPPPNIVHVTDTVLDISGAAAPGGFLKDAGLAVLKKIITIGAEETTASSARNLPVAPSKSCKKSDY